MLRLAYDFILRALKTYKQAPIVVGDEASHCQWSQADLQTGLDPVVLHNDFDRLADDVAARASNYTHSRGRDFTEHLRGVARLLTAWHQQPLVVQTGLLHSAYSTQQYPYGLYKHSDRAAVRQLLGKDGERLVFLFCSHDRVDLYAQAIELARNGRRLPAAGLRLRNALTGASALVPQDLVVVLLLVHAADLVEQMNAFNFEMIYALLAALDGVAVELPACYEQMRAAGVGQGGLPIEIKAARGTFGLLPVLGLNRALLPLRFTLARLLRGSGPLRQVDIARVHNLSDRFPYVLELPWIRLMREPGLSDHEAQNLLAEVRALHGGWGVPWVKSHFEDNSTFERLVVRREALAG